MGIDTFRLYDAYGPFGDETPGRAEFIEKYGVDLLFSGKTCYRLSGTHGSGKSSLCNTLLKYEPNLQYLAEGKYVRATIFPSYKFIGLGEYRIDKNCGGCDTIKSPKNDNPATLKWIAENLPGYSIEASGTLVSHLMTPINQFKEAFPDRVAICAFMNTTYETCIQRIKSRSNHDESKEFTSVKSRYDYLVGHRRRLLEAGVEVVEDIDTSGWTEMFRCYQKIEERYGGLNESKGS